MTVTVSNKALFERVDRALDKIRPHLEIDDGNIELIDVDEDMTVTIKWLGNCEFCTMSDMTMRAGIEQAIKSSVPEISRVVAVNGIQ